MDYEEIENDAEMEELIFLESLVIMYGKEEYEALKTRNERVKWLFAHMDPEEAYFLSGMAVQKFVN